MTPVEGLFEKKKDNKITINPVIRKEVGNVNLNFPTPEEIAINNFDEIKLHLRTEFTKAVKEFDKIVKTIVTFDDKKSSKMVETITDLRDIMSKIDFTPVINIPTIKVPNVDVKVPTPQITVNPHIGLEIERLILALKPLQLISDKPAKPISVQVSDGKAFIKALSNVSRATEGLVTTISGGVGLSQDEFQETYRKAEDRLASYRVADVDADGTPNYYGFVNLQNRWYILKEILNPGADTYRYATGNSDYTTNWTGRAGLTYSYYNEVAL